MVVPAVCLCVYVDKVLKHQPDMTLRHKCSSLTKRFVVLPTTPAKAEVWWKFSLRPYYNAAENGNEELLRECMHACV